MKKLLGSAIVTLAFLVAVFLLVRLILPWLQPSNGYLRITSSAAATAVLLDGNQVGQTPYAGNKIKIGDHKLTLQGKFATSSSKTVAGKSFSWSAELPIASNIQTVVNLDLGPSETFTASEILSLQKGTTSISIASEPNHVNISMDGENLGQTALVKEVPTGVHRLNLSKDGYSSRQIDINVPSGYQTIIQVTLAANPLPTIHAKLMTKGSLTLYSLGSPLATVYQNPQQWADAVWFFQDKASSLDTKFDALLDSSGKIYYYDQNGFQKALAKKAALNIGYLGKSGDTSLSKKAQSSWDSLAPSAKKAQVQILTTPTGTLNVRSAASLSGKILVKIQPGEKYDLLGESSGWYKIKVGSLTGWISSQYAKKL